MGSIHPAHSIHQEPTRVRGYSEVRLPFEPQGSMKVFRDELRAALSAMDAPAGRVLAARYVSAAGGFVDVENVLLYNVGGLGRLTAAGVHVERVVEEPDPVDGRSFPHLSDYRLVPGTLMPPAIAEPMARLAFAGVRLTSALKPHEVWDAAKAGTFERSREGALVGVPFALDVKVSGPRPPSAFSVIKPLLDGIVAALQSMPTATPDGLAEARLAAILGTTPRDVAHRLHDAGRDVIGPGRLVRPYRTGIMWAPADDRCKVARVTMHETAADQPPAVEVTIGLPLDASGEG